MIYKKAKTPGRKVKDIKIMDKYSFITVPLQEAEYIMRALNSKKDSKPLVEKATGTQHSSGKSEEKKSDRRSKGRKKSEKETSKKSKKSGEKKTSSKTSSKTKEKNKKSEKSSSKKKKSK